MKKKHYKYKKHKKFKKKRYNPNKKQFKSKRIINKIPSTFKRNLIFATIFSIGVFIANFYYLNQSLEISFYIAIAFFIGIQIIFTKTFINMVKESDKRNAERRKRQREEREHLDRIEREESARTRGDIKERDNWRRRINQEKAFKKTVGKDMDHWIITGKRKK